MPLARQQTRDNGTAQYSGSTWGRPFTGSFDVDGKMAVPDADFQSAAVAFEVKLGALAFQRGATAAGRVAEAAVRYLDSRAAHAAQLGAAGKTLDQLYSACGSDRPGFAGSVGTAAADVRAAMTTGNVRERLTAVQAFVENVLLSDTMSMGEQGDKLLDLMEGAGYHMSQLEAFKASNPRDKWSSPFHQPGAGEGSEVANVDVNRANRDELGLDAKSQRTDLTMATASTPLSPAEQRVQGVTGPTEQLQWLEGARKILLNEDDKWVKLQRSLSMPLKGGPSGHTYKFMQANQILSAGNSPDEMRLACLGYLLPINAHSMIEVMEAARTFGATPFPNDKTVYRHVTPLSEGELRECGGGRFPDEGKTGAPRPTAAVEGSVDQGSVPADLRTSTPSTSTGTGG